MRVSLTRTWCQTDLYFLLRYMCRRADMENDWIFDRCREVQGSPDGMLDLWARGHYKSTILTFGLTLQDILNDPDVTIGIFSHTRPIAKGFLRQVKRELEANEWLKALFPEILYANPKAESPKWSEDDGIIVKRKSNPKEGTVEAWGLIDGQPTSKHFKVRVYDDVVTRESVTTPEMISKTTEALELSTNLGSKDGKERYAGTRYHFNDTYSEIIRRGAAIPRVHPATVDGTVEGTPVLLSRAELDKKRRDQGPYTFCFPPHTPVLMADWSERAIKDVKVGDEVVGYDFPKGSKSRLVRSRVKSLGGRIANVIRATFESGRTVECSDDHKWYTGRRGKDVGGTDSHKAYLPLGFKKHQLKSLISVYDPRAINIGLGTYDAGWLAGFFDGDGAVSAGCIRLHQSITHNPRVCARIEEALKALNFDYGFVKSKAARSTGTQHDYYLRGGRQEKLRFLNICRPTRGYKIIDALFDQCTREFGKACRDKLVKIEHLGPQKVMNIETETGNYIAWGYATKNSAQQLLNPIADDTQGFNSEWVQYYQQTGDYPNFNKYILVDPANEKKKSSDYTSMVVIGLGQDENYYLLDAIRDRLNLTERADALFSLHKRWKPLRVGYERYGIMSDIQHIKDRQQRENYRFEVVELAGKLSKPDRIRRLIPIFETGRVYFPETIYRTDYEGKVVELVQTFIEQEYKAFPVGLHDDMLDAMSRIMDEELSLTWPKQAQEPDRYRRAIRKPKTSWQAA